MPTYLGIDYGTKRIGLAWADSLGIALPVKAIRGTDFDACLDELSKEIKERKIDQIVIGYPLAHGWKEREKNGGSRSVCENFEGKLCIANSSCG